jgi:hypothetical protein
MTYTEDGTEYYKKPMTEEKTTGYEDEAWNDCKQHSGGDFRITEIQKPIQPIEQK